MPPAAKKPRTLTVEERALADFTFKLGAGPCLTTEKLTTSIFRGDTYSKVPLDPYDVKKWIDVLQYDPFIKLKLENILAFIKEHNIHSEWIAMFDGLLALQKAVGAFEKLFENEPSKLPPFAKPGCSTAASTHTLKFTEWVDSLNNLIYWKRDEQK